MENRPQQNPDQKSQEARIPQHRIGSVYDRVAGVYDIWGKLTESRARDRVLELADTRDGQNILEVAVGTGIAFKEIVKQNPHGTNTGIDLSQGMLNRAESRLRTLPSHNYRLSLGSAFQLEFPDESIDTLVNNYMFDLIPFKDMDRVIREFKRVLKPGGKLALANMTHGERFGSHIYEWIYRVSPGMMGGCRAVELSDKLIAQGFTISKQEYFQQMLFPSRVILAVKQAERGF